jgi:hypothetical protein
VTVVDLSRGRTRGSAHLDFDLHGVVVVRLLDPRPGDQRVLERQLGPTCRPADDRVPDVSVRFVDSFGDDRPLTYVGYPEAGYHESAFYLLRGKQGARARTRLPFADVGRRPEVVCERGVGAVPHLLTLVNLAALAKGVLPLHASAFVLDGQGVLATGWSKGGKTETLLAFAAHGARYVGDEWIYLSADGRMTGVPEPIRLWDWHLRQLPEVWAGLGPVTRTRLRALTSSADLAGRLGDRLSTTVAGSVLRRAEPVLRRQSFRQVPPAELFGERLAAEAHLDVVLLATSQDAPDVRVDPVDPQLVARRMRASLAEEREPFLYHYRQFRFAFPDLGSELVDGAAALEADLLAQVLHGVPAYQLRHPYPFALDTVVGPVAAALREASTQQSPRRGRTGKHGETA